MAKGDQFEFELIADSPFQTAFTSIDWEGTYDNKGIRVRLNDLNLSCEPLRRNLGGSTLTR
jgi:hypothetical protein